MATTDMDITLENLLNLALGNPEIGAVNFNFLHEVITEILKHLGISKKLARVTQELDFRLAENYQQASIVDTEPAPPNVVDPIQPPSSGANEGAVVTEPQHSLESIVPKQRSATIEPTEPTKTNSGEVVKSVETAPTTTTPQQTRKESTAAPATKSNSSIPPPTPPTIAKKQSNNRKKSSVAVIQQRRSSYANQRMSVLKGANEQSLNDAAILNRTIERRDSKTPAGDMWHVLNINRRVEAAEAAIQGMTNLIDTINSDLYEMKNNTSSMSVTPVVETVNNNNNNNKPSVVERSTTESVAVKVASGVAIAKAPSSSAKNKEDVELLNKINAKLNIYDSKMADIDNRINKMVTKEKLNDMCTVQEVENLIQENLANFEPSFPIIDSGYKEDTGNEVVAPSEPQVTTKPSSTGGSASEKDSGLSDTNSTKKTTQPQATPKPKAAPAPVAVTASKQPKSVESVQQQQVLKRRDSRESRTRIAYQEVSAKMLFLEQEITKAKSTITSLEALLSMKVEMSAMGGKLDKNEFDRERLELSKQIKSAHDQISALEKAHRNVGEEVSSLVSQNDEFSVQQRKLSKAMQKLERNLEDMTDTFHRSQTDIVRKTSTQANAVDETTINKIRGTIFDMQEQQSKFQNQVDSMLQDTKNKEKVFENMKAEIKDLKDTKVDKDYVQKKLSTKVDQNTINSKVERDQFDVCVNEIDRNIQNILQKMEGTDAYTSQAVNAIETSIREKMDRDEMKQLHSYIDTRFKTFKPKIQEKQRGTEDTAAGTKKQLVKNCHCISCDRPVDMPINGEVITLPYYQALPGVKSMRPMNTFDLQTLRQHMHQTLVQGGNRQRFEMAQESNQLKKELLQLCGVRDLDELAMASNRACGGEHTMIEQHRRNPTKAQQQQQNGMLRGGEDGSSYSERQQMETEVRGRDGHIYRGRVHSPVLPNIRKPMPEQNVQHHPSSVDDHQTHYVHQTPKTATVTE